MQTLIPDPGSFAPRSPADTKNGVTVQSRRRRNESEAELGMRDLMALIALPALWAERDGQTIILLMTEALARIVPLCFSYAEVFILPGHPCTLQARVGGMVLQGEQLDAWRLAASVWPNSPSTNAVVYQSLTPLGEMRVVRFKLGYSSMTQSVWFGSQDPAFPTTTQLAVMRAATSLAATGLQAARANHEREEASRAKDEFLAMLGHELRNPLAPISAASELLRFARLDDAQLKKTTAIIARQVAHMTNLVNDLLDVSRVTSGLITLDTEPLEISLVVADAIEQVRPLIESRQHTLTTQLSTESGLVMGDEKRLVQVFANILINSAKYTPPGGHITLRISLEKSQVVISVHDDGIGIDPLLLPKVFELFTQAKRTPDRTQGGLGLGLPLVKNLVQLHGGSVTVQSAGAGAGALFTVTLPRLAAVTDSLAEMKSMPLLDASCRSLRLMVVDDNKDAAHMIAMLLQATGHEVHVENDPYLALAHAGTASHDVYLLDIGLPGMDGNELARRLRSLPHAAQSVLIALTGYGQQYDRESTLEAGFDHHFVKPVDPRKLLSLLANIP